jgi:YidC/Oxa1 family membrane protein insertase
MSWFRRISSLWREFNNLQAVLSLPENKRRLLVYSEDVASHTMFGGYLDHLMEVHHLPVVYITSAPDDPLLDDHHPNMSVYYVNKLVPNLIPKINAKTFLTTMPDLGQLHVARPSKATYCLYVFHSLNSIHEVYRQGAFDNYDGFFCTGPHHKKELAAHFDRQRLKSPDLHEIGYVKLDRICQAHSSYERKHKDRQTILLAPSWGKGNLLESHGIDIVRRLIPLGKRIVIRPHPCFFLPIYREGRQIIDALALAFEGEQDFEIERSIATEDSFHEADIMVSDFSGAAYEYALGTLRPVLFIDVARKTLNPNWQELGIPTFEDKMRFEVGRVLPPEDLPRIDQAMLELLRQNTQYKARIEKLRQSAIYNFGRSAEVGARVIKDLMEN